MNQPRDTPDPDDQLVHWGLGERLAEEPASDLVAAVHARLQSRDPVEPARRVATPTWLAAAAALMGVAVVFGVAFWSDGPASPAEPQRDWQDPIEVPLASVVTVADAQALPLDTRAVQAFGVDDEVVAALTRLRDLEVLAIRDPCNESYGMSVKVAAPDRPRYISNACWQHFATFTKLRQLRLSGTVLVCRTGSGRGDDVVAALERLPLLQDLSLRCLDASDAVLARLVKLRSLRRLDLSFNHGFGEEGMKALLQCRSLRVLSLRGCQQLHGRWLATLRQLPELQRLDVSVIDRLNWRNGTAEPNDLEGIQLSRQAGALAKSPGAGVTDEALDGLSLAPSLRALHIGNGRWTDDGLSILGRCETLRELNLFGGGNGGHAFVADLPKQLEHLEVCGEYDDEFCLAVRKHLTSLRHLSVAACYEITDRGLAVLLTMPSLRVFDMAQMYGLTAASVDALAGAQQLEELDLRHNNKWLLEKHVRRLERALPGLRKLQTSR